MKGTKVTWFWGRTGYKAEKLRCDVQILAGTSLCPHIKLWRPLRGCLWGVALHLHPQWCSVTMIMGAHGICFSMHPYTSLKIKRALNVIDFIESSSFLAGRSLFAVETLRG